MKGNLWIVGTIALALALAVPAINIGFSQAAVADSATENTTIDYQTNYTLANDDPYEYTSLNVSSNGSELEQGLDYLFNESEGTINWQNTAETSDGDDATVSYEYRDHDEQTTIQADILRMVSAPIGLLLLITALGYLVVLTFRGAGGGGF